MTLYLGSPAPIFQAPSPRNPAFGLSSLGGRWILLAFLPPPGPERDAALNALGARRELFLRPDATRLLYGVLPDRETFLKARDTRPGISWFDDAEGEIRRLYGAAGPAGEVLPQLVLIDPSMRVFKTAPLADLEAMLAAVAALPDPGDHAGPPLHAPVLIVPRVFEPQLCRRLIDFYHAHGGGPSGVMREQDGLTVGVLDDFKRRRDAHIADQAFQRELKTRIVRRLLPEIDKAYQFTATRLERYVVARYDAEDGGYFRPHRDNTTAGTAHRRFAVSINLNAEEFEGGDLRFAEFGPRTYRPPTGGAVVFSCSLLHEAMPVTRGTRYAFLPFLYDAAGAAIREANLHLLATGPPQAAT
jgi:predicted 2-oxoglutarate/Fe(II)-dependent dioxygenase YbiX